MTWFPAYCISAEVCLACSCWSSCWTHERRVFAQLFLLDLPASASPYPGSLSEVLPLNVSIVDRSSTGHTFVNDQQPGKGNPMKLSAGDAPWLKVELHNWRYVVRVQRHFTVSGIYLYCNYKICRITWPQRRSIQCKCRFDDLFMIVLYISGLTVPGDFCNHLHSVDAAWRCWSDLLRNWPNWGASLWCGSLEVYFVTGLQCGAVVTRNPKKFWWSK